MNYCNHNCNAQCVTLLHIMAGWSQRRGLRRAVAMFLWSYIVCDVLLMTGSDGRWQCACSHTVCMMYVLMSSDGRWKCSCGQYQWCIYWCLKVIRFILLNWTMHYRRNTITLKNYYFYQYKIVKLVYYIS